MILLKSEIVVLNLIIIIIMTVTTATMIMITIIVILIKIMYNTVLILKDKYEIESYLGE